MLLPRVRDAKVSQKLVTIFIRNYSCINAAGSGAAAFKETLDAGKIPRAEDGVHRVSSEVFSTSSERLVHWLIQCWNQVREPLSPLTFNHDLGIILASTKGAIEDKVWNSTPSELALTSDSLNPLLSAFIKKSELNPKRTTCVSNACASSHAALFLARKWLQQGIVKQVLVLAVDEVGPFILKGFQSLKALSPTGAKPFSEKRDGLALGEGAAAILLSTLEGSEFRLGPVALNTEGYAVTRPSPSGNSLLRACNEVLSELGTAVDGIVAHGTATKANDAAEDSTFKNCFENEFSSAELRPWVTGTKWCIGHTLGASGMMDTIAALEILRSQKVFGIAATEKVDAQFKSRILNRDIQPRDLGKIQNLLVTSLGFSGTHAALVVQYA